MKSASRSHRSLLNCVIPLSPPAIIFDDTPWLSPCQIVNFMLPPNRFISSNTFWSFSMGQTPSLSPWDAQIGRLLDRLDGWSTYAQFQFARRWWVSGRYDWLDGREVIDLAGARESAEQSRWGASISWVASEFQALRLEFSSTDDGFDRSNSVFLQYNVTIGSHPAHLY